MVPLWAAVAAWSPAPLRLIGGRSSADLRRRDPPVRSRMASPLVSHCSAGNVPITVTSGKGSHFQCVDGLDYIDFCLGNTGAMAGHAPPAAAAALADRAHRGATFMLPSEVCVCAECVMCGVATVMCGLRGLAV